MQNKGFPSKFGLENHHLKNLKTVYWNLYPPMLVEEILARHEAELGDAGVVVVNTGQHTGRSPNDKFIVQNHNSDDAEIFFGKVNQPLSGEHFDQLLKKAQAYLQGRDVFVQDMQAGAHPVHHLRIRVITELAWQSLFARDLFVRIPPEKSAEQEPEFTVIACPGLSADPAEDGTKSGTFIALDFTRKIVLIGGSHYAGEIKKSIFSVMNYLLPRKGILSMHCSANVGKKGDVALFFGLSGTGKTTLSSDPDRLLIGDDEHGWADDGVFNIEGGCYAKTINLKAELEPVIWEATRQFGTVLENVVLDPDTRKPNFDDGSRTENTRAAYPLEVVACRVPEGYAGHPENVFFLTADAFGVLPPISCLTPEQAMYYFLSGYTSKLAGTERGLGAEPEATFSTCFGAPFLPLNPHVYADLLGEKIHRHNAKVWLVNTGWTGGAYGVGKRMKLPYTRAMISAALNHQLDNIAMRKEPFFGLAIPVECPGVPSEILNPISTWADQGAYERQAMALVERFKANFKQFEGIVAKEITAAGPDHH